jgi:hypothetical protein
MRFIRRPPSKTSSPGFGENMVVIGKIAYGTFHRKKLPNHFAHFSPVIMRDSQFWKNQKRFDLGPNF